MKRALITGGLYFVAVIAALLVIGPIAGLALGAFGAFMYLAGYGFKLARS